MTRKLEQPLEYWSTAKEPWPSLLFILPFLLVYEVGTLTNADSVTMRNGADLWIRQLGTEVGFVTEWAVPLLAPVLLLFWQLTFRRPWKWNYETLAGMFAESLIFAMILILLGQLTAIAFPTHITASLIIGAVPRAVSFLGAGIYEEMLFRLTLIPAFFMGLRVLLVPARISFVIAILLSSLLFAAAHYVNAVNFLAPQALIEAFKTLTGSPCLWFSFTFRFLAGVLFSLLFCLRGFGIAVGSHVLYDLAVGVLLADIPGE